MANYLCRDIFICLAIFLAVGCGSAKEKPPEPAPPRPAALESYAERHEACDALRDHGIALFADEWAAREGVAIDNDTERWALRKSFAQELRSRGALDRLEVACLRDITPERLSCALGASTAADFTKCLR